MEDTDKRVQPPTVGEVETLLGELFRIADTYCEKKETKAWKNKLVNYWAGKKTVNVEPLE